MIRKNVRDATNNLKIYIDAELPHVFNQLKIKLLAHLNSEIDKESVPKRTDFGAILGQNLGVSEHIFLSSSELLGAINYLNSGVEKWLITP